MSKLEKAIEKLKSESTDITYHDIKYILGKLEFYEDKKGKTSGSRIVFRNDKLGKKIELHKPHPRQILKRYQIKTIVKSLEEWRIIS